MREIKTDGNFCFIGKQLHTVSAHFKWSDDIREGEQLKALKAFTIAGIMKERSKPGVCILNDVVDS